MLALGLVETKGLLAAIEGADAMLKAADVRLLEKNLAGGGLVTITIAGEVSAVAASVSAAVAAIERICPAALVSRHVIPRPDAELAGIIALKPREGAAAKKVAGGAKKADPGAAESRPADAQEAKKAPPAEEKNAQVTLEFSPVKADAKAQPGKSGKKSSKKR